MKYLEYTPLARINAFFTSVKVGDYVLHGDLEAYSCKLARNDKKLSRSLDEDVIKDLATSPSPYSVSPVGPLTDATSRKTLIYLILTLNHVYPDHDFSALRAHHFTKEMGPNNIKSEIDSLLMEASRVWANSTTGINSEPLLEILWAAIDEVISLNESDVYSYRAQLDGDPFTEEGSLWNFTFFFYNRKLKRILCFSCRATSKTAVGSDSEMESDAGDFGNDYEEDFADQMDL